MFTERRARTRVRYKTGRELVTAMSTHSVCIQPVTQAALFISSTFVATILKKKNDFVCLQPESEEKSVVYDNIGPNVCMGDHKVKIKEFQIKVCVASIGMM